MGRQYRLAEQTIDEDDLQDLIAWLKTNPWLTQGELVHEFERQWAEWLSVRYTTFVNSGSSANLLMYDALLLSGKLTNKKIVLPAVSWSTSVAPAIQLGFEPILCEADEHTFGLDLDCLERLLQAHHPGAVLIVHTLGVPNDMEPLLGLKDRFGFILMEDACAAIGSRYDNQLVGTFGDVSTFSFYYGHHLSTIEGGMICTHDEAIHDIFVQIRSHGWGKDLSTEKSETRARKNNILAFNRPFTFYYPGYNLRSTDLNARIGLSQMKKIDYVVRRRIENHNIYQSRFQSATSFHCQRNDRASICSIAFVALAQSQSQRERIAQVLRKNHIETRPLGGGNMSRQPFWANCYESTAFPVADRIHETAFQLPNHPRLSPEDIQFICDTVLSVTTA
ncbi:MAG: DegT/DnrJ/EryC1/StrS family aminotransferase [Candidatus Poribacteria bacterium]|nr:DegT/DnrJ/EryC1/StrS family aminotransferase [Candidatus Poribacteria bacterium]